ncbi:MAG: hypothetical protein WCF84_23335 [Anaerolineae bacterium]
MPEKPPDLGQLFHQLQHGELERDQLATVPLDPSLALLRTWQADRLARTYADLLENPSFAPACQFFLSDIYAPRDFSQRDRDAEHMHSLLSRIMPAPTLKAFTDLIELNRLTQELDAALCQVLVQQLGMTETLTGEMYAEAYRCCDNRTERESQIQLIQKLLIAVGEVAQMWGTGTVLKVARGPVHRGGYGELFDYTERGYIAFKPMRNYKTFAAIVARRENEILSRIFQGHPDPFAL